VPTNIPPPEGAATAEAPPTPTPAPAVTDGVVEIPGGPFTMGIDSGSLDEGPAHEVDVAAFQMDKFER
jgi:formylglycine-generating enzyme required for sulfatase activity